MSRVLKILLLFLLLFLFPIKLVKADDKFCLDRTGFIYPIFDGPNCLNKDEELISQKEFTQLIDLDQNKRLEKLTEVRKNPEKYQEVIITVDKAKENTKKKKELSSSEKRKLELEQRKLARLANELKKKEEFRIKKEKRLLEQKKRRANIESRKLAKRKKLEIERQKKEALKKEKIKKAELKKIARKKEIEEKQKARLAKLNESKKNQISSKKSVPKIDQDKIINKNLKIVVLNNNVVNKNLMPDITGKNVETIIEPSNQDFNNFFDINKNVIVLIPRDFENISVKTAENRMVSQQIIGIDQVRNPEINRIEAELRRAERDYIIAERKFQRATQEATNYNPYGGWASVINQWAGLAGQSAAGKERANARQRLESWSAKLSSTPMTLEKERYGSYNYDVAVIKAQKNSLFDVLKYQDEKFFSFENFKIEETKDFKVAYGISSQDRNPNSLRQKYSTEENLSQWNSSKMQNISNDNLIVKLNSGNGFSEIKSRAAFKLLGQKTKGGSFWSDLFSSKPKKNKKIASISNQSNYQTTDDRFDSVVIVKSRSGMGSGFYVSSDEIITNYHVVEGALSINIIDKNKKRSSAVVIKKDLKRDLALLKTNLNGKPVTFFKGKLKQGDMVEALGHPKGRKFSLTKGWISAIRNESSTYNVGSSDNVLFIQTDAAINPGNSGGPLFHKNKVVGVNTQGLHKDSTEGMNFAVHFSEVQNFLSK